MASLRGLPAVLITTSLLVYSAYGGTLWSLTSFASSDILKDFKANPSYDTFVYMMTIVNDPAGGHDKVLQVVYPKDTFKPSHHPQGGAQFYSHPIGEKESMTLTYDVYFAKDFDWVLGGKLPGLMGGVPTCSGGRDSDHCFTSRFMFRPDGDGEVYFYAPHDQDSDFCDRSSVICNFNKGHSLGRGTWKFTKGAWNRISQHVHLNQVGHKDGYVKVWLNGKQVYEMRNLLFRSESSVKITGMMFSTFFGGGNSSWATPHETHSYFRNFYFTDNEAPHIVG